MNAIETIVTQYIARYNKQIRTVTSSIRDYLGINYFTYHNIRDSGRYVVLVDRPDWAEYYVNEQCYKLDPFLRHPDYYQSGIASWSTQGTQEFQEKVVGSACSNFDMNHGVVIINKTSDGVEMFGFSSSSPYSRLKDIIANDITLFRSFGHYFKGELASILVPIEEENVNLKELLGNTFFKDPKVCHSVTDQQRIKIIQQQGLGDLITAAQKLSKRERQCLQLILANKTASEMGDLLNLSSRTVEHYLENAKDKLGVLTRSKLIEITQKLYDLRLIF